jgi:hypothetical protein
VGGLDGGLGHFNADLRRAVWEFFDGDFHEGWKSEDGC